MLVKPTTNSQVFVLPLNPSSEASLHPSMVTVLGSRSAASLADWIVMPITVAAPMAGLTANPAGFGPAGASLSRSKFKYFAWVLSMAFATPSEPGLLDDDAIIGSPGCVMSLGAPV